MGGWTKLGLRNGVSETLATTERIILSGGEVTTEPQSAKLTTIDDCPEGEYGVG